MPDRVIINLYEVFEYIRNNIKLIVLLSVMSGFKLIIESESRKMSLGKKFIIYSLSFILGFMVAKVTQNHFGYDMNVAIACASTLLGESIFKWFMVNITAILTQLKNLLFNKIK